MNCLNRHSGAPTPAVVVLLAGLLTPSCTIGESGSGPLNHGPIILEYTGTWVVQYLPTETHVPLKPGHWQVRHAGIERSLDVERGRLERLPLRRPKSQPALSRARKR